ncbi:3066_t:CDS:2, partial [Racocetra persica]
TLLNTEHNHQIDIETTKFATAYKSFSQEIMEQIKYYVIHGRCDATMIRNLLQPKYPDRIFLTQDLGNAIQKIKREHRINLGDTASLLTKLLEFQANDSRWFVKPLIDDTSSTLYQDFLKDFKNIQRSYCEDVFEKRIEGLFEKYRPGERYITMLLDRKHMWVKCFTSRCFTAGTQSTQRVESENALIQKVIQSSYSLLEVQEALENRLEFESINNRYSIWKTSTIQYTQPYIIQTFFTGIDYIIKKYLTQPICDAHYKQMCQS